MPQHTNPLERTAGQPGTAADPATPGASSIGDDAGVFEELPTSQQLDHSDTADGGIDPKRAEALRNVENDDATDAPPAAYRPDSVVRGVSPQARQELAGDNTFGNEPSFTKGRNAPTLDQMQGASKTVEALDQYQNEAPRGLFPDTPGGAGATPLAADRHTFIENVHNLGHFPSIGEAEKWTRAVFNALRHHAYETDDALVYELKDLVRFGEAPEVQVEEMMWGGDFVDRFSRMASLLQSWNKQALYEQVAEEAHESADDPWVDAAVHSFFGALKRALGDDADRSVSNLGELQDVWNRA